jgi:TetR/AcrR family transcriptional regulator, mexJK operon transcriptional repressor
MNKKIKRPPGRPPKKPDSDPQTEQKLLYTAAGLFMEKGYEQVSMEQIADICQVTKATVYYYFPNKAVLFTRSVVRILGHAADTTLELLDGPGTLKERLIRIAAGHLEVSRADFTTMFKEAELHLSLEQVQEIRNAEKRIHDVMADAFLLATRKGELKALPPFFLSYAFSSLLMLGNRQAATDHYASPIETAHAIVGLFLEGVQAG